MPKRRRTHEEFIQEVYDLVKDEYEILGEYKNNHTKIKMKHCLCGHEWDIEPKDFLHKNTRCPNCFGSKKKTNEEIKKEIFNLVGNEYVLISDYKGTNYYITLKHNKCNNNFEVRFKDFLTRNSRCPNCRHSKGEYKIKEFLNLNNIKVISQFKIDDCKNIKPLPFDFAVFDNYNNLDFLIEYDGELHYKPSKFSTGEQKFIETQRNDKIKTEYCKRNNIKLLRIPYWDFDNIDSILEDTLLVSSF